MSGDGLPDLVRDVQRRGLLLAQSRLRPIRREGHDGPTHRGSTRRTYSTSGSCDSRTSTATAPPTSSTSRPRRRRGLLQRSRQRVAASAVGCDAFPHVDDLASVATADLLGNGTACLVWSSALPNDATRPMRYLDLVAGRKPHLLVRARNNLGAETRDQLRAVDPLLPRGQGSRATMGHPTAVPGAGGRARRDARPHQPATRRSPATAITTATSTVQSASSAGSGWWSGSTPSD